MGIASANVEGVAGAPALADDCGGGAMSSPIASSSAGAASGGARKRRLHAKITLGFDTASPVGTISCNQIEVQQVTAGVCLGV